MTSSQMSDAAYIEYAKARGFPWVEADPGWLQYDSTRTPKTLKALMAGSAQEGAGTMFHSLYAGWLREHVPAGLVKAGWDGEKTSRAFVKRLPPGTAWPREGTAADLAQWLAPDFDAFRADVERLRKVMENFARVRSPNSGAMDNSIKNMIRIGDEWDETFSRLGAFRSFVRDAAIPAAVVAAGYYEKSQNKDPRKGWPDATTYAEQIKNAVVRAQSANAELERCMREFREAVEAGLSAGIRPKDSAARTKVQLAAQASRAAMESVGGLSYAVYRAAYEYWAWAINYTREQKIKGARTEMPLIWAAVQASQIILQASAFAVTFTPAVWASPVLSLGSVTAKLWGEAIIGMKAGMDAQDDAQVRQKLGHDYQDKVEQLKNSIIQDLGVSESVQKAADQLNAKSTTLSTAMDIAQPVAEYAVQTAGVAVPAALSTAGTVVAGVQLTYTLADTAHQVVDKPELLQIASDAELRTLTENYDRSKGYMQVRGDSGATIAVEGRDEKGRGFRINVGGRTGLLEVPTGFVYWDHAPHLWLRGLVNKARDKVYFADVVTLPDVALPDDLGTGSVDISLENVYARNREAKAVGDDFRVNDVDCTVRYQSKSVAGLATVYISEDGKVTCEAVTLNDQ